MPSTTGRWPSRTTDAEPGDRRYYPASVTGGYRRRTLPTGSFLVSRPRDPDRIFDPSIPGPEEGRDFGRITGLAADPAEGEGAGVGHLYSSADNGGTWSDISANFPDIPVNSVQSLPSGGLLAGTDLGVLYRAPSATNWHAATHGRGIWRISGSGL